MLNSVINRDKHQENINEKFKKRPFTRLKYFLNAEDLIKLGTSLDPVKPIQGYEKFETGIH